MKIIDLEQGSDAWLEFRRNKIGASDASIILGLNPWTTPLQLYKQKISGESLPMNAAMQQGKDLEDPVRDMLYEKYGISFQPIVIESDEHPWMIASLDGWNEAQKMFAEIKCGGKELYEKACFGEIPDYYMAQIQHQWAVNDRAEKALYSVFYRGDLVVLEVKKDPGFIDKIIKEEGKFYENLMAREAPEAMDRDYEVFVHGRASELLQEYLALCKELKSKKARQDEIKNEIIELGPQKNFILDGVKIYQSQNTSYDFEKMREAGINLSDFKRLSRHYWLIAGSRTAS